MDWTSTQHVTSEEVQRKTAEGKNQLSHGMYDGRGTKKKGKDENLHWWHSIGRNGKYLQTECETGLSTLQHSK